MRQKGFTLMDSLIVVCILAMVAVIGVPIVYNSQARIFRMYYGVSPYTNTDAEKRVLGNWVKKKLEMMELERNRSKKGSLYAWMNDEERERTMAENMEKIEDLDVLPSVELSLLTNELEKLQMEIPSTAERAEAMLERIRGIQVRLGEIENFNRSLDEQIEKARDVAEFFGFHTRAEEEQ